MNSNTNRNRHMLYRKSVYRRRRIRNLLILGGVALAVLVVLFLVIGNLLLGKSRDSYMDSDPSDGNRVEVPAIPADSMPEIQAAHLSLSGKK